MVCGCDAKIVLSKLDNITKSCGDKRSYRGLQLHNKLKLILVSDPTTEKSAAALDVNVGYLNDPNDIPGVAHFCEHMLFLGTKKYPDENEYNKFLTASGGMSNAYTSTDHTQYYFDVLPDHLPEALDRFSQFFISPLFTESATSRELNAVNSEHEKNLKSDSWRLNQLDKQLSKEGHPYGKFGTGNKETLEVIPAERGLNVRDELLAFHNKWYSANTMALAVLGKEGLDELEAMVLKLFEEVSNKQVDAPEWLDHPVGPDQMRAKAFVVPVEDVRYLTIKFPIPDYLQFYKSAPSHYVSHLLGHEGPGSLLSALRARGWCNSLSCGDRSSAKGFAVFAINVDLTVEGLNYVDDITTLTFQYLNMLREMGPQEWIFDECRKMMNIKFRFKDKEQPCQYVSYLASSIHQYPLDEVLIAPYLMSEWRPQLIDDLMALLIPTRVQIAVISQSFEPIADLTEPIYGTKYKLEKLNESLIKDWENCGTCNELKCPKPNIFIPENFDILPLDDKNEEHSKNPVVIHASDVTRLWFKQDDVFLLPKALIALNLKSSIAYLDPLNAALTYMFVVLLKDELVEYSYDASLGGLEWDIGNTKEGLQIKVKGFNDKLQVLFDKVLEKVTNFTANEKRFLVFKEVYMRNLQNFDTKPPYKQSEYYTNFLLSEKAWNHMDLLAIADQITVEALEQFVATFLRRIHVEGLAYGNMNKERAHCLIQSLEQHLSKLAPVLPLRPQQLLRSREIQLRDGSHVAYELRNDVHSCSSTEAYFQCGTRSTQTNCELELLHQIIREPCFDILRTKEQLGYLVWSTLRSASGVQGLRFVIQSDKHPKYLLKRIEAFLTYIRNLIVNLTDEEFIKHRDTVVAHRLEKPKSLGEQYIVYMNEIVSQEYHFNRVEVEVAYLRTVTKDQVIEFFDRCIAYNAPNRHLLSVMVTSYAENGAGTLPDGQDAPEDNGPEIVEPTLIEDVTSFKRIHGLYPLPQPYIDFNQTKSKL